MTYFIGGKWRARAHLLRSPHSAVWNIFLFLRLPRSRASSLDWPAEVEVEAWNRELAAREVMRCILAQPWTANLVLGSEPRVRTLQIVILS